MKTEVVQAWVKDSPNAAAVQQLARSMGLTPDQVWTMIMVPIATLESRSTTLAEKTAKLFRKEGFRVETFSREEE